MWIVQHGAEAWVRCRNPLSCIRHGNVLNNEPIRAKMTSRRRKEQQQAKERWVWIVLGVGVVVAIVLMSISG
jgi:hypothetical protein